MIEEIEQGELCSVCKKKALYTCPHCGARYCCMECFSKHSPVCVAKFSRRSLEANRPTKASNETILAMRKTLSNADKEFIPVEVEPWNAWWEAAIIKDPPQPLIPPPEKVSPLLPYHLSDILYSYCYVMRLYNGDVSFDIEGAAEAIVAISAVLYGKPDLHSVKQAISECISNSRRPDLFVEYQWQVEVVGDVEKVLRSPEHVCRALSETYCLLKEAKQKRASSKSLFFFAWAPTFRGKELEKLRDEVHEYYTSLSVYLLDVHEKESL